MATPAEILDGNGCFSCLDENILLKLQTILLYEISGLDMTPSEILALNPCIACLPENMQGVLQTILLDQILGNTGNASGAHFFGSGSPEGVVTASVGATYLDVTNLNEYDKYSGMDTNTGWL